MSSTIALKELVGRREAVTVPGVPNALFARLVEDLGYEAVYVSGAGVANMNFGLPDLGLIALSEIANTVSAISHAVSIPIIVDMDTGYGNTLNVIRSIEVLERSGASGVQIEDQVFPKKCGHFEGKQVIGLNEMIEKIRAATDARQDDNFQIIARTDSRATKGLSEAIDRASAFFEAGADLTFVEAPQSVDELDQIAHQLSGPQVANMVFGGRTPDPGRAHLKDAGFSIVLYANAALQASVASVREVLGSLREHGSLASAAGSLASFEERQRLVAKDHWDALERKYRTE